MRCFLPYIFRRSCFSQTTILGPSLPWFLNCRILHYKSGALHESWAWRPTATAYGSAFRNLHSFIEAEIPFNHHYSHVYFIPERWRWHGTSSGVLAIWGSVQNILWAPALANVKYLNKGHHFQKLAFVFTVTLISDLEFYANSYTSFGVRRLYPSHICTIIHHKKHNWTHRTGKIAPTCSLNGQKVSQHLHLNSFSLRKNRELTQTSTTHSSVQLSKT